MHSIFFQVVVRESYVMLFLNVGALAMEVMLLVKLLETQLQYGPKLICIRCQLILSLGEIYDVLFSQEHLHHLGQEVCTIKRLSSCFE